MDDCYFLAFYESVIRVLSLRQWRNILFSQVLQNPIIGKIPNSNDKSSLNFYIDFYWNIKIKEIDIESLTFKNRCQYIVLLYDTIYELKYLQVWTQMIIWNKLIQTPITMELVIMNQS